MKPKYGYVLPCRIKACGPNDSQLEIITQKSSFVMGKNELTMTIQKILHFMEECTELEALVMHFSPILNERKLSDVLEFLQQRRVIYLSDEPLTSSETNLVHFLSHYTNNVFKYYRQLREITFCLPAHSKNTEKIADLLEHFGLQYRYIGVQDISELTEQNYVLVSVDSCDIHILDEIGERLEEREGCLWSFVLFYQDSFMISPILNQKKYISYSCMKDQLEMPQEQYGLTKNTLLENIGHNHLLMEVLTSITKLNIKTNYGRTIKVNTVERTLEIEKVYHIPRIVDRDKAMYIKRWDDEK